MAYANLGLVGGYALALDKRFPPFLILICLLGIATGIGFDLTLREGMRCLEAHRCKVDLLDDYFAVNSLKRFLFCSNAPNRREALKIGPAVCIMFWIIALLFTTWFTISGRMSDSSSSTASNHVPPANVRGESVVEGRR